MIGCQSIKGRIKYKCYKKIPQVLFARNFFINYALILNTNGTKDKNILFIKTNSQYSKSEQSR